MFGVIVYIGACMGISGLVAFLWVLTKPIHTRDEQRSWRLWMALFAITIILPYGFFEVLTRTVGKSMKTTVEDAVYDEGIKEGMRYYKVLFATGDKAWVVAVGSEDTVWGGKDSPVLRLVLHKNKGQWEVESTNMVYSDNRNLDGVVFPPFW